MDADAHAETPSPRPYRDADAIGDSYARARAPVATTTTTTTAADALDDYYDNDRVAHHRRASGSTAADAAAAVDDAGDLSTTEDDDSTYDDSSYTEETSEDDEGGEGDGFRPRRRRRRRRGEEAGVGGSNGGGGLDDDAVRAARAKRRRARRERDARREGSRRESATSKFAVCGTVFEVDAKYAPIKPIGKGAYGVVCSARDVETNKKVAIKKIVNAFENIVDAKRTLREIKLLRHLRHENVIDIIDCVKPASKHEFEDVYLMYDLMDTDLYQIIRSSQSLTDEHCQYFVYQILRGLKYIHSADVLHRDLKPGNLLLNANCDLKICDFGLARTALIDADASEFMTEYVVTRWYRAPELLLSCAEYTSAIDVWSVGCIFAELLGRKTLFPGKDYIHQLNLIMRVIGTPKDESELDFINNEKAKRYIKSLPATARCNFEKLFPNASPRAIDLIDKMLVLDPAKRITVEEALEHPYLESLHDEVDEPCADSPFTFDFEDGARYLTEADVRRLIFDELCALSEEFDAVKLDQLRIQEGGSDTK
jgi:mitogen-activated protein kinase 6